MTINSLIITFMIIKHSFDMYFLVFHLNFITFKHRCWWILSLLSVLAVVLGSLQDQGWLTSQETGAGLSGWGHLSRLSWAPADAQRHSPQHRSVSPDHPALRRGGDCPPGGRMSQPNEGRCWDAQWQSCGEEFLHWGRQVPSEKVGF